MTYEKESFKCSNDMSTLVTTNDTIVEHPSPRAATDHGTWSKKDYTLFYTKAV